MTLENFDKNLREQPKKPKEKKVKQIVDKTPFYTKKRDNSTKKLLRETILGHCKVWGKENIIPIIEEILEEAKAKDEEHYF